MIKTRTKTHSVHQILCDCGGEIELKGTENAFANTGGFTVRTDRKNSNLYYYEAGDVFAPKTVPTCKRCNKKFQITFNTNKFIVEVKEL